MKRKRKTTMAKGTGFFSLFKKKGKAKTVSQVALHDAKDILDSSSGKPFGDVYKLGSKLGEGAFSIVKEGTHKQTRQSYAIKVVSKAQLSREDEVALKDEIDVLNLLDHEHIIRLFDVFEESSYYYLVTEKMGGGELFDRIVSKSFYNEKEARNTCKIIFHALAYCHSRGIAHRDLKPENLLLSSSTNNSEIKIADFGFAKKARTDACLYTQCGTPGYVAPEILEGVAYGTKVDDWSIGVITYILLGGYPPFIESNQRQLFKKIRRGDFKFHDEYWGEVSEEAKELISALLTVNPRKRLTSAEALNNSWITCSDEGLAGKDLGTNLSKLKTYNAKRKLKHAVLTLIATNKMTSLGVHFRTNLAENSIR